MSRRFEVAVMHDFFVDRLVHSKDLDALLAQVAAKASSGGGGIHDVPQTEVRGGNAVNLAHALAKLGLRTLLITHSDASHDRLLRSTFEGLEVDLRVKEASPGFTVALEGRSNVMLGDGGGAAHFGPEALEEDDWRALRSAEVVCSVNWAANERGTELLMGLRKKLGKEKVIYFDPADPRDRKARFRKLLQIMRKEHLADWVSFNQHEALAAAGALGIEGDNLADITARISEEILVSLDVHTGDLAMTASGRECTVVKTSVAKPRRLTGAGDVWGAASIYGRVKKMRDPERLKFANEAARLYLEAEEPSPPSLEEVESVL